MDVGGRRGGGGFTSVGSRVLTLGLVYFLVKSMKLAGCNFFGDTQFIKDNFPLANLVG